VLQVYCLISLVLSIGWLRYENARVSRVMRAFIFGEVLIQ
jgi:hypothetical protein